MLDASWHLQPPRQTLTHRRMPRIEPKDALRESRPGRKSLSERIRTARERKGLTLEALARELWISGFPTSQNKLWRMENRPPKRPDKELLLWLERKLEVQLVDHGEHRQVLLEEIIDLLDGFAGSPEREGSSMERPTNPGLAEIYDRVAKIATNEAA